MNTFKSRFGFHPVSRETSKKLRFLNGVYQKALHLVAAHERWESKAPQNRVRKEKVRDNDGKVIGYGEPSPWAEPQLCPIFSEKVVTTVKWHPKKGYFKDGIELVTYKVMDQSVPAAARQARTPVEREEDVRPLYLTTEQIDALYAEAKAWVESQAECVA